MFSGNELELVLEKLDLSFATFQLKTKFLFHEGPRSLHEVSCLRLGGMGPGRETELIIVWSEFRTVVLRLD